MKQPKNPVTPVMPNAPADLAGTSLAPIPMPFYAPGAPVGPFQTDVDQQRDVDYQTRLIDLCTLTGEERAPTPRTAAEIRAAGDLIWGESAERGRSIRGDDRA